MSPPLRQNRAERTGGGRAGPESGAGPGARSAEPPAYGLDFVDRRRPPNRTGLPDRLKAGVEALSGVGLDDVRVHYGSSRPARLRAAAYTLGSDIHVAPGQERHLPHEAWHVVQQKQARADANRHWNGMAVNVDPRLEREAEVMGQRAAAGGGTANPGAPPARPAAGKPVVQMAITVGMTLIPRTASMTPEVTQYFANLGVMGQFKHLNDDSGLIYMFSDDQHLVDYLKKMAGLPISGGCSDPIIHRLSPEQRQEAHGFAQDVRFSGIYQPSSQQISFKAPGAHNIPNAMMPPSGPGHHWGQAPYGTGPGQAYTLYQNTLTPPPQQTVALTFGNPDKPSLIMNQGGLNLGMHIQPTDSRYLQPITRAQTNYANIDSVTGRVRGHPFELAQNQISTDDPRMNFDNEKRAYTDESDSTKDKGGISSWRFNEVEKKATGSGLPFTQINNNPVKSTMDIGRPDTIHFRLQTSSGGYDDLLMDNTSTTDYRNTAPPKGVRKQAYQTEMGRQEAKLHPYQEQPIHRPGEDFTDANRYSYPGYMSPPPTPFLSEETFSSKPQEMIIKGYPDVGSRIKMPDGGEGVVVKVVDRDHTREKTRCQVKAVPKAEWPGSFI